MALSMKNTPELTTEDVRPFLIQPLEAASVVLAQGPRIFDSPTGDPLRIPKLTTRGSSPSWYAENELIGEVDPDFGEFTLLPTNLKSVKVIHRFSNELARHSVVSIANTMQASLVKQVADKIDTAFLLGDGAVDGNGNRSVIGLLNQAGIQVEGPLDVTTATSLIDSAITGIGKLLTAEIRDLSNTVFFVSIDDYIAIQGVKGSDGRPLLVPDVQSANVFRLQGIRVVPTSKLTAGTQLLVDFNQVAVGRDLAPSVKLLDQTYANYDQLAIRIAARLDIGLLHSAGVVALQS